MPKKLKPCPFCSSQSAKVDHFNGDYHVRCDKCGAQGPTADTWDEAESGWNTRPRQKPTDGNSKH